MKEAVAARVVSALLVVATLRRVEGEKLVKWAAAGLRHHQLPIYIASTKSSNFDESQRPAPVIHKILQRPGSATGWDTFSRICS